MGEFIRVKEDTRSLDYSSCKDYDGAFLVSMHTST